MSLHQWYMNFSSTYSSGLPKGIGFLAFLNNVSDAGNLYLFQTG